MVRGLVHLWHNPNPTGQPIAGEKLFEIPDLGKKRDRGDSSDPGNRYENLILTGILLKCIGANLVGDSFNLFIELLDNPEAVI